MEGDCSHEIKRCFLLGRKVYTNLDSILKSRDIILPTKVCMLLNCDGEDPESLFVCKIKSVNPKGNQSWIFIGRTDAETEAEAPILWLPDAKSWFIGKDPDAGKDGRWEEKGTAEDELVGWYHQLNACKFEQALGVGDGHGSLVCCSSWSHRESDITEQLNWTELIDAVKLIKFYFSRVTFWYAFKIIRSSKSFKF